MWSVFNYLLKNNFVPEVGKKKKISNNFWVVNTLAEGIIQNSRTSCPLGISFCVKGGKKAQLCADELENFMNIQEIHMPLQINH